MHDAAALLGAVAEVNAVRSTLCLFLCLCLCLRQRPSKRGPSGPPAGPPSPAGLWRGRGRRAEAEAEMRRSQSTAGDAASAGAAERDTDSRRGQERASHLAWPSFTEEEEADPATRGQVSTAARSAGAADAGRVGEGRPTSATRSSSRLAPRPPRLPLLPPPLLPPSSRRWLWVSALDPQLMTAPPPFSPFPSRSVSHAHHAALLLSPHSYHSTAQ